MRIYNVTHVCACIYVYMHVCMYVIFKLGFERYRGNCPSWEGNCPGGNCPGGEMSVPTHWLFERMILCRNAIDRYFSLFVGCLP